ncbi:MAG TPA: hypothetical protein VGE77_12530, partial [Nocardioides sp.]
DRFHAWASAHPVAGCAHDDLAAFTAWLPSTDLPDVDDWLRLHAVADGRRRIARVTLAGRRTVVIGIGPRTWYLTRRHPAGPSEGAAA